LRSSWENVDDADDDSIDDDDEVFDVCCEEGGPVDKLN
jgi:hypothetical protein